MRDLVRRYSMSGLVIEPIPDSFRRLVQNYSDAPRIVPVNAAIAGADGTQTIYRVAAPPGSHEALSALASFHRDILEKHAARLCAVGARIVSEVVPTMTPRTLLARHPLPRIDILQVDAEGDDAKIVSLFLDCGHAPAVIQYEHRHLPGREDAECRRLLHERGYLLARFGPETVALLSPAAPGSPS